MPYKFEAGQILVAESSCRRRLETVERVTPSGIAVLEDGAKVNPTGRKRGDQDIWNWTSYQPATEQDVADIKHEEMVRDLRSTLRGIHWNDVSLEKLKAIEAILKGET